MLNHCENLNINLIYNIHPEKTTKNVVGKKINKVHKTSTLQTYYNDA